MESRQLPLRRAETAAVFALVVQVAAASVAMGLAVAFRSQGALAAAWHLAVGIVVWVVALVHQRFRRLADEEAHEVEAMRAQREREASSSLFEEEQALDLALHRHRLAGFERYFLPAFSIGLAVALGWLSFALLRRVATLEQPPAVEEPLLTTAIFAGMAFVCFLLGRYTGGLATYQPWRAVRPGASFILSNAAACFLVCVGLLCYLGELAWVDRVVAYVVPSVLALMALEVLLNQVLAIYRPRTAGQEPRPAYDSRLLGMLAESRGLVRTAADTLDYQFGFKVSDTWFFRFMERAIAPLILFQAVTLWLLTCLFIVYSGEEAVIERWGRPLKGRETLKPGLHLKWPWPIDVARRYPVERVEMLMVGEQIREEAEGTLWTESHAREPFRLLVANKPTPTTAPAAPKPPGVGAEAGEARPAAPNASAPVSMLSGTIQVYYKVKADGLYDFLYNYTDESRVPVLEALCYRELTRYTVSVDLLQFLTEGRAAATATLRREIQTRVDELGLGVFIVGVSLTGVHPPVEVGQAFEDYASALEDAHAAESEAEAYANRTVPASRASARQIELVADAYRKRRELVSQATAERFELRLSVFDIAPRVFLERELLAAMEEGLAGRRKIIKPEWANANEVIQFDLHRATTLPTLESLLGEPSTGGTK
jgi:regulator of protease activity HflC (stomatin/prohibitin superfamily)